MGMQHVHMNTFSYLFTLFVYLFIYAQITHPRFAHAVAYIQEITVVTCSQLHQSSVSLIISFVSHALNLIIKTN